MATNSLFDSLVERAESSRLPGQESLRARLQREEEEMSLWLEREHPRFVLGLRLAQLLIDFLDTDDGRRLLASAIASSRPTCSPKGQSSEMRGFCP